MGRIKGCTGDVTMVVKNQGWGWGRASMCLEGNVIKRGVEAFLALTGR